SPLPTPGKGRASRYGHWHHQLHPSCFQPRRIKRKRKAAASLIWSPASTLFCHGERTLDDPREVSAALPALPTRHKVAAKRKTLKFRQGCGLMFTGSITALVTPLRDGALDETAFRDLVEWQIAEGTHGLVPVGTTGESPTLSHDEHKRVVEICIETAKG